MRAPPLLCKLLPALLCLLLSSACDAEPPEQDSYSAEAVRQDFDALYEGLKAAHFDLFAHRPKEEYDALYGEMRRAIAARFDAYLERGAARHSVAV